MPTNDKILGSTEPGLVSRHSRLTDYSCLVSLAQENYREILAAILVTWLVLTNVYHLNCNNVMMDAKVFYMVAVRYASGLSIYMWPPSADTGYFLYSPAIPMLMRPLLRWGDPGTLQVWFGLNIVALSISGGIAALLSVGCTKRAFVVYCAILAMFFHNWAFTNEAFGANCQMLLALIFSVMLVAVRFGKHNVFAAGVAIGACFKLWMVGIIGYLALKRKFKEVIVCLAIFACSFGLMFQIIGWDQFDAFAKLNKLYGERKLGGNILMHSISAFGDVHLKANTFMKPLVDNESIRNIFVYFSDGAILLTLLWVMVRKRESPNTTEDILKLCFFISSMFLVMPVFHLSYVVVLLPGLAWLIFTNQQITPLCKVSGFLLYLVLTRIQVLADYGLAKGLTNPVAGLLASMPFFWLVAFWAVLLFAILNCRSPEIQNRCDNRLKQN